METGRGSAESVDHIQEQVANALKFDNEFQRGNELAGLDFIPGDRDQPGYPVVELAIQAVELILVSKYFLQGNFGSCVNAV